ncbi:hypothetical protein AS200_15165 [Streptomyces sp. CdTB01]|nr:hypothetical protein AS200_15165 [Streptomyces sp. CdTB01]
MLVDQDAVVAVEGRVRDAEAALHGGEGWAASGGVGQFENGVDGGLHGVGVGQGAFRGVGSGV